MTPKKSNKIPLYIWLIAALSLAAIIALLIMAPIFLALPVAIIILASTTLLIIESVHGIASRITASFTTRQFQSLIETIRDGVIIYTPDFKIIFMNTAAEELTGITKDAAAKKAITPELAQDPAFGIITQIIYPTLSPTVTQISEGDWPQVVDITLQNPPLVLRTILNQVHDEAGQVIRFIKIVDNRTRESSILESKREFLDTVAHQLRTPVTAIAWALENIVTETQDNPGVHEIAEDGLETARAALDMINGLLQAARIEEGKFGYNFKTIDIAHLLEETATRARAAGKKGNIEITYSGPKEAVEVHADPERIGIALANIISNALEYNRESGFVNITLEEVPGKPFVRIVVKDTGVGIPQEEQNKLFTKFFRASNITDIAPDGTGLGLYITRNIIKNHGGEIGITSTLERGTTVWFTLPTDPNLIPKRETVYDTE